MRKVFTFEDFKKYIYDHVRDGWREESEIKEHKILKNNGIEYTGINFLNQGETISPTIYLEMYYNQYCKGVSEEMILNKIREEYDQALQGTDLLDIRVSEYQYIKERVIFRVVNWERNAEMLADCPHIRLCDLAVTFRWMAHHDDIAVSTALITNREMDNWEIGMDELLLDAGKNTEEIFPGVIKKMEDVLTDMCGVDFEEDSCPMYIATNSILVNGATVMLYEGFLQKFAEQLKQNFFILPSSLHELILVPEQAEFTAEELRTMVSESNQTVVHPEDYLSDSVYYYDRITEKISCCPMMNS